MSRAGLEHAALHIDWTRCAGRGLCPELVDAVGRDEWGYPLVRGGNDLIVAGSRLEAASEAVAACPLAALRLVAARRSPRSGSGR